MILKSKNSQNLHFLVHLSRIGGVVWQRHIHSATHLIGALMWLVRNKLKGLHRLDINDYFFIFFLFVVINIVDFF